MEEARVFAYGTLLGEDDMEGILGRRPARMHSEVSGFKVAGSVEAGGTGQKAAAPSKGSKLEGDIMGVTGEELGLIDARMPAELGRVSAKAGEHRVWIYVLEGKIRQEDCNEDGLGSGILTLTNRRIAFDKTVSRIADFSKRMGDTKLDIPLEEVEEVWKEGVLTRKACVRARGAHAGTYKFGVFSAGSWVSEMQEALDSRS
ncbi:MAG: hypothetical protein MPJ08_05320 [Nitrosopumilus sp.]|nr:hypothetical protein [Nitrosopumilus sp.]